MGQIHVMCSKRFTWDPHQTISIPTIISFSTPKEHYKLAKKDGEKKIVFHQGASPQWWFWTAHRPAGGDTYPGSDSTSAPGRAQADAGGCFGWRVFGPCLRSVLSLQSSSCSAGYLPSPEESWEVWMFWEHREQFLAVKTWLLANGCWTVYDLLALDRLILGCSHVQESLN